MESHQYAKFLLESDDHEGSAKYYSQILVKSIKGHPQELFDVSRSLFESFCYLTGKSDYQILKNYAKILRKEFVEETDKHEYSSELMQIVKLCKEVMQLALLIGVSEGNKSKSEYRIALNKAKNLDRITGYVHDFLPWVMNLT